MCLLLPKALEDYGETLSNNKTDRLSKISKARHKIRVW